MPWPRAPRRQRASHGHHTVTAPSSPSSPVVVSCVTMVLVDDAQTRIDRYLEQSGLAARKSRVVALTGDASTRRYFRVIPSDGPSIVLALHDGPIDYTTLPFVAVAGL